MISFASEPTPLDIEDVQHLREAAGEIRLRVSGHWRGTSPPSDAESALLVIQIEGRRHRFAPVADPDPPTSATPGRWTASFVVPAWAEPRREGQAALWIGEAVVPVPPIGAARNWPGSGPPAPGSAVPADLPDVEAAVAPAAPAQLAAPAPSVPAAAPRPARGWERPEPTSEPGRAGPLADMLLKEMVAALRVELEARAAEAASLRGALASAQSELETRTESQGELEGTLAELRAELRRLTQEVDEHRIELDRRETDSARAGEEFARRLAETTVSRDDQATELIAVREELASARGELVGARDLHAAELAAAREGHAAELAAAQDDHAAELAATRKDHAAELAALSEQHAISTGAERDQSAGQLRELNAELTAARAAARRHAGESDGLREELAAAQVGGEVARSELAGLRAELERLGGEAAVTREHIDSQTGDLDEANRLLADARALAEQLRAPPAGS